MSDFLKIAATLAICSVFVHAGEDTAKTAPSKANPTASLTDCGRGNIVVEATPDRADILVDGSFAGNAPATLKLPPGKHSIRLTSPGYTEWQRDVTVYGGSEARLTVSLTKADAGATATASASPAAAPGITGPTAAAPAQPAPAAAPVAPVPPTSPAECGALGAFSDEHPKNRSDGIKVTGFAPRSPAAKAGLQVGDYILALAGTYVFTIDDLSTELCKYKPGTQIAIRYRRNMALDETTVVLGRP